MSSSLCWLRRSFWAGALRCPAGSGPYIPAKFARLPIVGGAVRPNPAETVQVVARMRPDLIIEAGPVTPEAAARAEQVQQQTGVPYILLDNGIQATPHDVADHRGAARRRRARRRSRQIYRLRHRCAARQIIDRAGRRAADRLLWPRTGWARNRPRRLAGDGRHRPGGGHQCRRPARPRRADEGDARPGHRLGPGNHHRPATKLL